MLDQNNNIFKYISSTEMIQSYERRSFLKNAGLMGLALVGGAAGIGSLNGCQGKILGADYTRYDFNAVAQRYDPEKVVINNIADFALSDEELGTMRLCELNEKIKIPIFSENPLKGRNNEHHLVKGTVDVPLCEEWLLAEYTGRTYYPDYRVGILVNKFSSKEDALKIEKLKIEEHDKTRNTGVSNYFYSKHPFLIEISTGIFQDRNHMEEHLARMNLYQRKRGLNLIRALSSVIK